MELKARNTARRMLATAKTKCDRLHIDLEEALDPDGPSGADIWNASQDASDGLRDLAATLDHLSSMFGGMEAEPDTAGHVRTRHRIGNFGGHARFNIPKGTRLPLAPANHAVSTRLRDRRRTDLVAVTFDGSHRCRAVLDAGPGLRPRRNRVLDPVHGSLPCR